jgi:hypothetical protein
VVASSLTAPSAATVPSTLLWRPTAAARNPPAYGVGVALLGEATGVGVVSPPPPPEPAGMMKKKTAAAAAAATTRTMMTMSSAGPGPLRGGPPAPCAIAGGGAGGTWPAGLACAGGAAADPGSVGAISAPQPEQNRASSSLARPQEGQFLAIVALRVR